MDEFNLDCGRSADRDPALADAFWIVCATPDTCEGDSDAFDDPENELRSPLDVPCSPLFSPKHADTDGPEREPAEGRRFWRKCTHCGALFNKNRSALASAASSALVSQASPDHAVPRGICDDCITVPASRLVDWALEIRSCHRPLLPADELSDVSGTGSADPGAHNALHHDEDKRGAPPTKRRRLPADSHAMSCDVAHSA
jgi:hypothetical protein